MVLKVEEKNRLLEVLPQVRARPIQTAEVVAVGEGAYPKWRTCSSCKQETTFIESHAELKFKDGEETTPSLEQQNILAIVE